MPAIRVLDLGACPWADAMAIQTRLAAERADAGPDGDDWLVLVEHVPPVITLGRGASRDHLRASVADLEAQGVQVVETDRGGDVTWHGPGQLVAWPVVHLDRRGRDVHRYLRDLEQTVIALLGQFDLVGARAPGRTGVWVGDDKVAACGVAIRRWVTRHGLALNVADALDGFDLIVPCGIADRGVTSLSRLLGRSMTVEEVKPLFVDGFRQVFGAGPGEMRNAKGKGQNAEWERLR